MAQRSAAELGAGAVVLVLAVGFLGYAVANTGRSVGSGYTLYAKFDRIDGLDIGSDVRVAGVKVGSVESERLDPETYQAVVDFSVQSGLQLPKDSAAVVSSDGLLGGKYLALEPGGDAQMVKPGGQLALTQSSISIEELLGKFIFSAANLSSQQQQPGAGKPAAPK